MKRVGSRHILILDGNSSHCLPLIHSLHKSGHKVTLVCPGRLSCGYFSRYGNRKLIWPRLADNRKEFYRLLLEFLESEKPDLVMGLSDISAALLSVNKTDIEKYTTCIVPEHNRFRIASDKYLTMQFCMKHGIPSPVTINGELETIDKEVINLPFPVVVKPKTGVGAVGFFILETKEQLTDKLRELIPVHGPMLVQEYIPNEQQYTVEAFCDQHSELKACIIARKWRYFPLNGGTSSCIETVNYPEITDIVKRLLQQIGWQGSANVDLILDPRDHTPKVIEINPRVGATVKIAHLAGVNIAEMTMKLFQGERIDSKIKSADGIVMRNLMLDLMWFIFAPFKAKWQARPSFFRVFGKNVHYQNFSKDDPFPFLGYMLGNVMKYAKFNMLKRKLGRK